MSRRRRKTWIFLLGLCTVSLATGAAVRLWADWPRVALAPEIPTPTSSTPFEAQLFPPLPHTPLPSPPPPTPSPSPSISFSSLSPEESDTVAISISGVSATGTARGTFASSNISFLRAANGRWVGLAGIDAKMAPGAYPLSLTLPDGAVRRETVQVRARDYPVTELAVTDELRKKGYTPPVIATNVAAENARLAAALAGSPPRAYFDGPFVNPLDFMENVGEYGNIRVSGGVGLRQLDQGGSLGRLPVPGWVGQDLGVREGRVEQELREVEQGAVVIAATTARTGLKVRAALDQNPYPPGVKVKDADVETLHLCTDALHPEWNYSLLPRSEQPNQSK